ncbi:MAG: histidine kinase dimerization/phosphoacceptor domain -containing protein [Candidatus Celaenobacter antarcticus]|nr:histidine kinase dimerization/phosphoacceptor domain -containing protein [Candidatus Celaenobacter antarcticus]
MYTENQIQIFVILSSIFLGLFVLTTIYLIIKLKLNSILLRQSEEKIKEYSEDLEKMVKERTKQLSKSEESYKQLYKFNEGIVEHSPAGIMKLDAKLKISYENPEMKRILGVPPGEESKAIGMDIRELASIKNIGVQPIFNNLFERKEIATENLFISMYGKKTYITLKGVPMFENNKFKGAVLLINDITERKKAESIQKTLYNISDALNKVDNLHELFIKIREYTGNVIDTTNFYVALYDEKTDMILLPFDVDEKDNFVTFPAGKTLTALVIKTGKPLYANRQLQDKLLKQGKIEIIGTPSAIWLGVPLKVEKKVIGVIAVQSYDDPNLYSEKDIDILTFISEEIALAIKHKQADEQIRRDLKEKVLLLREIRHRVKNNLQVISGLLQLQKNEMTTKEDALKGFTASQDRILAMAKAYELLLESDYMSEVSVGKYITSLAEQLKYNYDNHNKVNITYSLDDLVISIEILDRLGLILNEIITNAIKYAFEGRDSGNIHIDLKDAGEHIEIKISDNGIGIPKEIETHEPVTLGLSIVDMLTQQLQGTLKIDRKNGTSFTLVIPKESRE